MPGALEMTERAQSIFSTPGDKQEFEALLKSSPIGDRYQKTMQFIIECRGQDALNKLIRKAVLETRIEPVPEYSDDEMLEKDIEGWALSPALIDLGKLITEYQNAFQRPILTSNFDPLIEIAIRKAGRGAIPFSLPNDGTFRNLLIHDAAQVVHFHGYWRAGDTLHTPDQLTRPRPLLTGSLRNLLQETPLVVIGYGAWNDVFTRSLIEVIGEQLSTLDVPWTFYGNQEFLKRIMILLRNFNLCQVGGLLFIAASIAMISSLNFIVACNPRDP